MRQSLFDVVLSTDGDSETGAVFISVRITNRYKHHDGEPIAEQRDFPRLDDALAFARGAVTAFMEGTEA